MGYTDMKNLLSLLIILLVIVSFGRAQEVKKFEENLNSKIQEKEQRYFVNTTLEEVRRIKLGDFDLFRTTGIQGSNSGDLIAYDYALHKLFYFPRSKDKAPYGIGDGKGRGPREFINPTGWDFDEKGNIIIADPMKATITEWSPEGKLIDHYDPDPAIPSRVTTYADKIAFLANSYTSDGLLFLIDRKTRNNLGFQYLSTTKLRDDYFVTSGKIAMADGILVYAGINRGFIRGYNLDGKLLYSTSTITFGEYRGQNVEVDGNETTFTRNKKSIYHTRDVEVKNGKIYVLFSGTNSVKCDYVDVYGLQTGAYRYTIKLNRSAYDMTIAGEYLVVRDFDPDTYEKYITYYEFPKTEMLSTESR